MLSRLSVRLRLAIAFSLVMAVLFTVAGFAARAVLAQNLNRSTDNGLRARAIDVASNLTDEIVAGARPSGRPGTLIEQGERYAQVMTPAGRVVDDTPRTAGRTLLTPAEISLATTGAVWATRPAGGGIDEPLRLRAVPVRSRGARFVVVVGAPLGGRRAVIRHVTKELLIGGPLLLVAVSIIGYLLAAAALRPVEAMRRMAARIPSDHGETMLLVPPANDELSRLATTLNDMVSRVERTLARERQFVADASHELRSPLAVLKGELQLARRADQSAAEHSASVESAADEVERLVRIVDDLLLVASSDEGRLSIRRERLDVSALLDGARDRAAKRLDAADRPIRHDERTGLAVDADPDRLQQLLDNLIDNAIRHGAGPIDLTARPAGDMVEICVRDQGPGFPEGFTERAFARFTRANPARSRGGAGLGLSIVQMIADAHGGAAGVRSEGGCCVWVRLPAAARDPAAGDQCAPAGGNTLTTSFPENSRSVSGRAGGGT